ncbi:MAG: hypothetical protein U0232_14755 [Thermomicrobiales bacterium]
MAPPRRSPRPARRARQSLASATITVPADRLLFRLTGTRFPRSRLLRSAQGFRFDDPDLIPASATSATLSPAASSKSSRPSPPTPAVVASSPSANCAPITPPASPSSDPSASPTSCGDSLTALGIDLRITCGDDYGLAGAWSAAIHSHTDRVDGILYPLPPPRRALLRRPLRRARPAVRRPLGHPRRRHHPDLWIDRAILARFGVALLPDL